MRRVVPFLVAALPAFASYFTNAQVSLGGGSAIVYYNACGSPNCTPTDPFLISASAELAAITLGPVRNGIIEITGGGATGGPAAAGGSVGNYSFYCNEASCGPFGGFRCRSH
jgi:hypothetical protein